MVCRSRRHRSPQVGLREPGDTRKRVLETLGVPVGLLPAMSGAVCKFEVTQVPGAIGKQC